MSEPTCAICTYECDSVNKIGLCQNCESAYNKGVMAERTRWSEVADYRCDCDVDSCCEAHLLVNEVIKP